jgi:hypothetical protein
MFRRFNRAQYAAIAITAGALAAAGCSASQSSNSASHPSGGAAATPSGGGSSLATAKDAIQLAAQHAQLVTSFAATMNMQATGLEKITMAGTLQEQTQPAPVFAANFATVSAQGQTIPGGMQEIVNSSALYLKMAQLSRQTGKPWIKIPASELSKAFGASFGQLLQQESNDNPLVKTEMLASSTNVKRVGAATVDGVQTTEYTGSYPISAGLAKLPASLRAKIEPQIQAMGLQNDNFRIWLDGQQQVRKVITSDQGTKEQVTSTIQVTSINQPVSATPPPASQTATVPASAFGG